MKKTSVILKFAAVFSLFMGIAGCNIFNLSGEARVDETDDKALTYEGYVQFRKGDYEQAATYFEKASNANPANSEAWYGLAKSVLNQQNINVFELVKYARTEGEGGQSGFLTMPEEKANTYLTGIDTVLSLINRWVALDTIGKTDGKISFRDNENTTHSIAPSYAILQFTKVALLIRKESVDFPKIFTYDTETNTLNIDWTQLTEGDVSNTMEALEASAQAILANPQQTMSIIQDYVPATDSLTDEQLLQTSTMVADEIMIVTQNIKENEDRSEVFTKIGNGVDDDGDGCIDEEILDGFDNDGDGEVDEDARPIGVAVRDFTSATPGYVVSLQLTAGYDTLDLNMNGKKADESEWTYSVADAVARNDQGNHILVFAADSEFKWAESDKEKAIEAKEKVRMDTDPSNIKYDLAWRKANIGGCWNNYTEETFMQWFEGRN